MNNPRFRRFGILMVYITVWLVMAITSADAFLLSESEQDMIMEKYDAEQLRRLCRCLCISLRQIGDALDLVGDE